MSVLVEGSERPEATPHATTALALARADNTREKESQRLADLSVWSTSVTAGIAAKLAVTAQRKATHEGQEIPIGK